MMEVAPSAAKPNVHTNATPPSSEWATGNPTGDPKITISGVIWPIYGGGGTPSGLLWGRGANPRFLRRVTRLGNPAIRRAALRNGWYPVDWMSTPL
jgi:hypothetical protein